MQRFAWEQLRTGEGWKRRMGHTLPSIWSFTGKLREWTMTIWSHIPFMPCRPPVCSCIRWICWGKSEAVYGMFTSQGTHGGACWCGQSVHIITSFWRRRERRRLEEVSEGTGEVYHEQMLRVLCFSCRGKSCKILLHCLKYESGLRMCLRSRSTGNSLSTEAKCKLQCKTVMFLWFH